MASRPLLIFLCFTLLTQSVAADCFPIRRIMEPSARANFQNLCRAAIQCDPACQNIEPTKLINCSGTQDSNKLLASGDIGRRLLSCARAFFIDSMVDLAKMVIDLIKMLVGAQIKSFQNIYKFMTDPQFRQQTLSRSSNFSGVARAFLESSTRNFATEYSKNFSQSVDRVGYLNAPLAALGETLLKPFLSMIVNLLSEIAHSQISQFRCLNSKAKLDAICSMAGGLLMPPAVFFSLLKVGVAGLRTVRGADGLIARTRRALQARVATNISSPPPPTATIQSDTLIPPEVIRSDGFPDGMQIEAPEAIGTGAGAIEERTLGSVLRKMELERDPLETIEATRNLSTRVVGTVAGPNGGRLTLTMRRGERWYVFRQDNSHSADGLLFGRGNPTWLINIAGPKAASFFGVRLARPNLVVTPDAVEFNASIARFNEGLPLEQQIPFKFYPYRKGIVPDKEFLDRYLDDVNTAEVPLATSAPEVLHDITHHVTGAPYFPPDYVRHFASQRKLLRDFVTDIKKNNPQLASNTKFKLGELEYKIDEVESYISGTTDDFNSTIMGHFDNVVDDHWAYEIGAVEPIRDYLSGGISPIAHLEKITAGSSPEIKKALKSFLARPENTTPNMKRSINMEPEVVTKTINERIEFVNKRAAMLAD